MIREKRKALAISIGAALQLLGAAGAQSEQTPPSPVANAAGQNTSAVAVEIEDVAVQTPADADKLQSAPVSATVVDRELLEETRSNDLLATEDILPSLQIDFGNSRNLAINVRGLGSSGSGANNGIFGGTPVYVDGIYQTRPGLAVFAVPDLQSVAVLKGPQGTAGGMDSTGGAVFLTTALPTFVTERKGSFTYGSYNTVEAKGSISGPVLDSDKAAFRLSFFTGDRDGYIYNIHGGQRYNDRHDKAVRAQLLLAPDNDLTFRIIGDFAHQNQACCIDLYGGAVTNYTDGTAVKNNAYVRAARLGYMLPGNELSSYSTDITGYQQTRSLSYGASAIVNYRLNGFMLESISAFRAWDFHPDNLNSSPIGLDITHGNNNVTERSISQEFRISTPQGRPVEVTAGLFYLHDKLWNRLRTDYGADAGVWLGNPTTAAQAKIYSAAWDYLKRFGADTESANVVAPYFRGVWHATPNFDLTLGLRYSHTSWAGNYYQYVVGPSLDNYDLTAAQRATAETRRANRFGGGALAFSAATHDGLVSGLATASYKLDANSLGYITYSRGARAGGVNLVQAAIDSPTVKPEEIDNYELGVKSVLFDRRLTTNVAAFVMVDHNYITQYVEESSAGSADTYLGNAKRVISRGVEADFRLRFSDEFTFFGSAAYTNAFYDSFKTAPCPYEVTGFTSCDRSGLPVSRVPKWKAVVGGQWHRNLGHLVPFIDQAAIGYLGATLSYHSKYFSQVTDSIYSVISENALLNLNAGIRFADDSWNLRVWAQNAFDHHYFSSLSPANLSSGIISGQVGAPRMVGVTVSGRL